MALPCSANGRHSFDATAKSSSLEAFKPFWKACAATDDQVDVLSLFGRMQIEMIKGSEPNPLTPAVETRRPTLDELWKLQKWESPIGSSRI